MAKAPESKTFYATRDFKDAGTEKAFEQGKPVEATPGEIANYEAAGLVSTEKTAAQVLVEESHGPAA
jgi:hypothetical protein